MTEQIPINLAATEQRLVEELTGSTPPLDVPEEPDLARPGDPEPMSEPDQRDE